jgi:hypothetical protein
MGNSSLLGFISAEEFQIPQQRQALFNIRFHALLRALAQKVFGLKPLILLLIPPGLKAGAIKLPLTKRH